MKKLVLIALLGSAACKVSGSATASVDAHGSDIEMDAQANASVRQVQVHRNGDQLVHESGLIEFETDKARLVGDQTEATLRAYADVLDQYPELHLRIEGHTDSRASEQHNHELSEARAQAVRSWLIDEAAIDDERLSAVGHGEQRPKVVEPKECKDSHSSKAPQWCEGDVWSKNRRSEFHITAGGETLPKGQLIEPETGQRPPVDLRTGPYIYLSPGLLRIPVADRTETDARTASYRWGLGAGYLWRRNRFAAGLGLGFAHVPLSIDGDSERCLMRECLSGHELVVNAELRLGGGSSKVIGYGLLGPGLVIGRSRRSDGTQEVAFTTAGFNLDLGGGVWGLVWRGLYLGGELALNVGAYGRDVGAFHDRGRVTGLDLRFLIGWHFGWRG